MDAINDTTNTQPDAVPSKDNWRDHLPMHPAAQLFDPLTEDEMNDLTASIDKTHILNPIFLWKDHKHSPVMRIDGNSRLEALERAGYEIQIRDTGSTTVPWVQIWNRRDAGLWFQVETKIFRGDEYPGTAYDLVVACNIARRQLTLEKKRELALKLAEADPSKSDRQIAKQVGLSHHTVAAVRQEAEGRGQIAHVVKRKDSKGRTQPAKKPKKTSPKTIDVNHTVVEAPPSTEQPVRERPRPSLHKLAPQKTH